MIAQAHAMSPHQGAGAGQAIEVSVHLTCAPMWFGANYTYFISQDAFVLGYLLGKTSESQMLGYLDAYQAIRLPAANSVLTGSYESGMMYEFDSEYGDDYEVLGPAIQAQWAWIDQPSLEDELESALRFAHQATPASRL